MPAHPPRRARPLEAGRHDPRHQPHQPVRGRGRRPREHPARCSTSNGIDAIIAIGGEGTLDRGRRLTDGGIKIVGVPKTIDNDLRGHRLLVRLRHRRRDRHRGDRPPAHHRRLARALHGGRGHGPPRRLDRPALGHGRRRARDPHPRAAAVDRPDLRVGRVACATAAARRSSSSPRASRSTTWTRRTRTRASTRSTVRASAASPSGSPRSSRSAPASSRATPCSGHIQRGGAPSAYDRVLATRLGMARSTPSTRARGARWSRSAAPTSRPSRSPRPSAASTRVPEPRYDEARILFG